MNTRNWNGLVVLVTIFALGGCMGGSDLPQSKGMDFIPTGSALTSCENGSPPPNTYGDNAVSHKQNNRPQGLGFDYASLWITAVWDPCAGVRPTIEIGWVKLTALKANGQRYTLYESPPGVHGLQPTHELVTIGTSGLWGNATYNIPINAGSVARLTPDTSCSGRRIMHAFTDHLLVPADVTDIIPEAKVRLTGNLKVQVGYDWWQSTGTGITKPFSCKGNPTPTIGNCEGGFSGWVNNQCGDEWMIVGGWDPARNGALVQLGVAPPAPAPTTPPPATTPASTPTPPPMPWVRITQGGNIPSGTSYPDNATASIQLAWEASQSVRIMVEQQENGVWKDWKSAADTASANGSQQIVFYDDWPVGVPVRIRVSAGSASAYTSSFTIYTPQPTPPPVTTPPPAPVNTALTADFTVLASGLPVSNTIEAFRKYDPEEIWEILPVTGNSNGSYHVTAPNFIVGRDVLVVRWKSNSATVNRWGCMQVNGTNQLVVNITGTVNGVSYVGSIVGVGNGCDIGFR